jgi:hypothetical protein
MGYSTVNQVIKTAGFATVPRITSLYQGDMTDAQVTAMIQELIDENDKIINDKLHIPTTIRKEYHQADGETSEFALGPEDEEHQADYDPENCLVEVIHCYFDCLQEAYRRLHPYPVDCDNLITESNASLFSEVNNCTVTDEPVIKRAGSSSTKMVFSASGYARAVLTKEIAIDQYEYAAFLFRSSVVSPTFTLYLYDGSGNSNSQTFTVNQANQWYIIWIRLDNMTGTLDWEDLKLYKIAIYADAACTAYLDMFNFNDSYCWEAPTGKLYIHEADNAGEEPIPAGSKIFVTYTFNPYLVTAENDVRKASKYLAAADLIDRLIDLRQSHTAFEAEGESMVSIPDREALVYSENRLRKKAEEALNAIGYGFDFEPIVG